MPGSYWELPVVVPMGERWLLMGTPFLYGQPARTLYWLGTFDGTRFTPNSTVPRQFDILATYRAPTLARGPKGYLIAVGIVADEIRDEQARHASGWVHVLMPATVLELCADDHGALCQRFAPAFAGHFTGTLESGKDIPQAAPATGDQACNRGRTAGAASCAVSGGTRRRVSQSSAEADCTEAQGARQAA